MHRNQNGLVTENNVSCRAYYKEETAIDLCHGTECTVQNNSIRTAATHAVYCANLDDDNSGDCSVTITQNEIDAQGSSGIFVRDGVNATVKGNSITESGSGADAGISVFLNQQEVSISGNELVKDRTIFSDQPLNSPDAAVEILGRELSEWDREALLVLNLDSKNNVINMHVVSIGTINYSVTTMRELIKSSVLSNASSMIVMHNHPSGDVSPSEEDIEMTGNIVAVGKLMGIEVLDHIIVGSDSALHHFSFMENDMLKPSTRVFNIVDDTAKKTMAAEKKTRRKSR